MRALRRFVGRLAASLFGRRTDDRLREELAEHLALLTERFIDAGVPADEARRRARLTLGAQETVAEAWRDEQRLRPLDDIGHDLRYAARSLWRTPGFTAMVLVTLALGIGANSLIFSVVRAVVVRALPYPDADRFVRLTAAPGAGVSDGETAPAGITGAELDIVREKGRTLSHLGGYLPISMTLAQPDRAARVNGTQLSAPILAMLGQSPLMGRLFEPREERAGLRRVVVLSYAMWRRTLGGAADVVGHSVLLDGNPYTVVGVMRPGFAFPDSSAQFWIPFEWPAGARLVPTGRLADGVTLEMASAEINQILATLRASPPARVAGRQPGRRVPPAADSAVRSRTPPEILPRFRFVRLHDQLVGSVRPALVILTVAVGLVLLIACVNVANLVFARGLARQAELATRAALGAGRWRLMRQALTESLLLALAGGAAGTAVAFAGLRLVQSFGTVLPRGGIAPVFGLPQLDLARIDGAALIFALALSIVTGLVFGLLPARRLLRRPDGLNRREAGGRGATGGFSRARSVLVVGEIALAMVLFLAAGLLIRSFFKLSSVPPGFDTADILTFQVITPVPISPAAGDLLTARLARMPGVVAAGYATELPIGGLEGIVALRHSPAPPQSPPPSAATTTPQFPDLRIVSRDFLRVMGMRVSEGRGFEADDGAAGAHVMLINRTLARHGPFGPNPVGQLIYAIGTAPWRVVGIVEDARQIGLDRAAGPQVFIDIRQLPDDWLPESTPLYFALRTTGAPASAAAGVRELARQLDPRATLDSVATMDQVVAGSIVRQRISAVLLGVFAFVAVVLALIGIYGVMSYLVTQRTREIGIRMALGATRTTVLRQVVGESLRLIGIGLAAGWAGAFWMTGALAGLLFGITTRDPVTFLVTPALFTIVATLATLIPAWRAMRVDPVVALRDL